MIQIDQATGPLEIAAIRTLFAEYQQSLGIDLGFQSFAEELASLPGDLRGAGRPWRRQETVRRRGVDQVIGEQRGSAPHSFQLTRSHVSSNGLIVGRYERDGEIRIGDTALDSPSDREVARRERMKREG